ncbi:MAG: NUDIX hydrolase [Oscillospiraceae bacterium]|nr:NUDIX hydrolase [Oscillospiraceae bacterium]
MSFFEKQIETNTVYEGIIVDVRRDIAELQNGNRAKREVVVHPGGVGIVAVTADSKILMVRQYRYPMEEEVLEIPAGKLDIGEDPFECAKRELSEETGYTANTYVDFGAMYPSPGYCKETLYLYLALDLIPGEMHLDENELLSVEEIDIDELVARIMRGELKDAKTIIGILKAKEYMRKKNSAL